MVEREGRAVTEQAADLVELYWHPIAMLAETVIAEGKLNNYYAGKQLHSAFRAAAIPRSGADHGRI
jgi:hypothetical protein